MSSPNSTPRTGFQSPLQQKQNFQRKKATHLDKLPFYKRYPRGFIFGGALLTFCVVYSAPIYYFLRDPPEHINPYSTMWPSEIAQGELHKDKFMRRLKEHTRQKEEAKAAKELQKNANKSE